MFLFLPEGADEAATTSEKAVSGLKSGIPPIWLLQVGMLIDRIRSFNKLDKSPEDGLTELDPTLKDKVPVG